MIEINEMNERNELSQTCQSLCFAFSSRDLLMKVPLVDPWSKATRIRSSSTSVIALVQETQNASSASSASRSLTWESFTTNEVIWKDVASKFRTFKDIFRRKKTRLGWRLWRLWNLQRLGRSNWTLHSQVTREQCFLDRELCSISMSTQPPDKFGLLMPKAGAEHRQQNCFWSSRTTHAMKL